MATSASSPGRRSSPALWAGLLLIAAIAWVLLIRQSPGLPGSMAGPWLVFGEFLLLWVVMMTAMMLPSVAPVASMYLTVVRSRRGGTPAVAATASPWLLVAGLVGHGAKDLWQHRTGYVANTRWWPPFCVTVDWLAAMIMAVAISADASFT